MAKVEFDPFSDEVIHGDKYALYRRLRDEAPACYVEQWDCWALSRFSDIWDACMNPAFSSARGATTAHLLTKVQPVIRMLNNMDPPEHSRLRAKIRAFFVPRRVRAMSRSCRTVSTTSSVTWSAFRNPDAFAARESPGMPSRYLSVRSPCASGENTMHPTPSSDSTSNRPSSG